MDDPVLVGVIITGILSIIAAIGANTVLIIKARSEASSIKQDVKGVHTDANSRLTELLNATRLAARAEGVAAERASPGGPIVPAETLPTMVVPPPR